jgi:hypothetical protein
MGVDFSTGYTQGQLFQFDDLLARLDLCLVGNSLWFIIYMASFCHLIYDVTESCVSAFAHLKTVPSRRSQQPFSCSTMPRLLCSCKVHCRINNSSPNEASNSVSLSRFCVDNLFLTSVRSVCFFYPTLFGLITVKPIWWQVQIIYIRMLLLLDRFWEACCKCS